MYVLITNNRIIHTADHPVDDVLVQTMYEAMNKDGKSVLLLEMPNTTLEKELLKTVIPAHIITEISDSREANGVESFTGNTKALWEHTIHAIAHLIYHFRVFWEIEGIVEFLDDEFKENLQRWLDINKQLLAMITEEEELKILYGDIQRDALAWHNALKEQRDLYISQFEEQAQASGDNKESGKGDSVDEPYGLDSSFYGDTKENADGEIPIDKIQAELNSAFNGIDGEVPKESEDPDRGYHGDTWVPNERPTMDNLRELAESDMGQIITDSQTSPTNEVRAQAIDMINQQNTDNHGHIQEYSETLEILDNSTGFVHDTDIHTLYMEPNIAQVPELANADISENEIVKDEVEDDELTQLEQQDLRYNDLLQEENRMWAEQHPNGV